MDFQTYGGQGTHVWCSYSSIGEISYGKTNKQTDINAAEHLYHVTAVGVDNNSISTQTSCIQMRA